MDIREHDNFRIRPWHQDLVFSVLFVWVFGLISTLGLRNRCSVSGWCLLGKLYAQKVPLFPKRFVWPEIMVCSAREVAGCWLWPTEVCGGLG